MNRNSYVTAALFVVFALLTVFYYALGDEMPDSKVSSENPAPGINLETDAVSNPLDTLRLELDTQRSAKVEELKSVIASADSDATTKSDAKDSIAKINKEYEHAQALESMIKSKGYDDVLVRVNEDAVQVIVQVADSDSFPSVEAINELYVMAKTEFTNDPYVTVEVRQLN
ncbi:MAG TPA: hypothetical protein DCY20_04940 [Firmicutes bacterium]|nr:hypothetical protein [Bacillota bacterium]